jgi:hypothetical protein
MYNYREFPELQFCPSVFAENYVVNIIAPINWPINKNASGKPAGSFAKNPYYIVQIDGLINATDNLQLQCRRPYL